MRVWYEIRDDAVTVWSIGVIKCFGVGPDSSQKPPSHMPKRNNSPHARWGQLERLVRSRCIASTANAVAHNASPGFYYDRFA